MEELVMEKDFPVDEFLDQMLDAKNQSGQDVVGNINGLSVSTEGCMTKMQLQNKVAGAMHNYISGERNENPTKRQMDDMVLMLDESIAPSADWDDPDDVLDWIEASSEKLNDPELARTVYEDGKTPAEIMVDRLKEHGYGRASENQSETESMINGYMSDLENHGFLMSRFFNGNEPYDKTPITSTQSNSFQTQTLTDQDQIDADFFDKKPKDATAEETGFDSTSLDPELAAFLNSTDQVDSSLQEDEYQMDSSDLSLPEFSEDDLDDDLDDGFENEFEEEKEEVDSNQMDLTDLSFPEELANDFEEEDAAEIEKELAFLENNSKPSVEEQIQPEPIGQETPSFAPLTSEKEASLENTKDLTKPQERKPQKLDVEFQPKPKSAKADSGFFTKREKTSLKDLESKILPKREKDSDKNLGADFFEKREKTPRKEQGEDFFTRKEKDSKEDVEKEFFTKKEKSEEAESQRNEIHREFNVPSEDIQENLAAISWALATRKKEDIEQAELALTALPESQITEYYKDQINFIKASLEREQETEKENEKGNENEQTNGASLEEFQAKYGPTANEKEMEIVHKIEKELEDLKARKQEVKEELLKIQTQLKEVKPVRIGEPVNLDNKTNSDLAIQAVQEKARLSTVVVRNNAAMKDFYKAAENHKIIDIIKATNAAKGLGPEHTFTDILTHALSEISNTYYGKTPEELQEQLVESTKQFNEAQKLLRMNPAETVYASQLEAVKEAFNQIETDRSKEKIFTAMIEVQALGEDHPYSKTLTKSLDQIATIYHGRTAMQVKNQIIGCSKACNEAHEKIAFEIQKEKELHGANVPGSFALEEANQKNLPSTNTMVSQLQAVENALNHAIMNHSKENILVAATLTARLDPKSPSTAALNNALNRLAVTHLDTTLNELRWQDMRNAIENAKETALTLNNKEAVDRFNQAVKTHTKADIIVALNMAKELDNGYEMVGALNKMARSYYGVDAETLTKQFRNYSEALSRVKDMTAPNNIEVPMDAKDNEAMPSFYKAVQTKDEADIMEAIQNANRLPSYHPMKKPLLDALNAQLILVSKYEPVVEKIEEEVQENKEEKQALKEKATSLIQEYKDVDSKITKRENSLSQYAENKKKEKEEYEKQQELEKKKKEEEELEPPQKVIEETTNHNPNLFKKAVAGAKKALKDMSIKKVAKVAVIGAGIYFAPALMAVLYAGKKIFIDPNKKEKEKENEEATEEETEKKEKKPKKVKKAKKVKKLKKKKQKPVYEEDYEDEVEEDDYFDEEDYEEADSYEEEEFYEEDQDFGNEEEDSYEDEEEDYYEEGEMFGGEEDSYQEDSELGNAENPVEEKNQDSMEQRQAMSEILERNQEKLAQAREEDSEDVAQRIMEAESQAKATRSGEEIQFYKGDEDLGQWVRLNSQADIIEAMVDNDKIGYTTGTGKNQSTVKEIANEEVTNYLHTGSLQTAEEVAQIINESEYSNQESVGRGK